MSVIGLSSSRRGESRRGECDRRSYERSGLSERSTNIAELEIVLGIDGDG